MTSFRTRTVRPLIVAAAAACALGSAASGHAATAGWSPTRTLAGDVARLKAGPPLAAETPIHVAVSLRLRNEEDLDARVADILAGRSHTTLSSQQVLERYSPTAEQARAVADYLREAGFANVAIAGNRLLVSADGTAAMVQKAFDTALRHVEVEGRDAWTNESAAQVPARLAGIVNAVHGLDTSNPLHLHYQRADSARAVVPDLVVGHHPAEFSTIYDADSLATGSKTTIAIMSAGDISQSLTDLAAFVSQSGYTSPKIEQIYVGQRSGDTAGVIEWDLDSQTSLAVAGGKVKKMIFYIATNVFSLTPFVEAFNQAVVDNEAKIVNASLGTCEIGEHNNGDESSIDASFKVGIAQGQTFTISSGDSGARECSQSITGGESYPAVSPYATAIGGTTLSTNGQTGYASEVVWSGGGGGMSTTEAEPKYQKKALAFLKPTGRAIPDISFSASPSSGAILVIDGGNGTEQVGGTSLSAPMFMGFWARIQSIHGNTLVSPNSAIYKFTKNAANAALYTHDVTSGTNGYVAGPGYDLGSGYGSLDVADFASFVATHGGF
jgi:pseudomonalisin/xanthomonalisin